MLTRLFPLLAFVALLAGLFVSHPADALTAPAYTVQSAGQSAEECISCPFFVEMDRIKGVWSTKLYNKIAGELSGILATFVGLYLTWIALMMIVQPNKASEQIQKLPMLLLTIALVVITLTPTSGSYSDNSPSLVWEYLMGPIENTSLLLGREIVSISGDRMTRVSGTNSYYAYLAASIEAQIWAITDLANTIMFGKEGGILNIIKNAPRLVAGLILLLPYLFVIGVFFAFLVEALFKYISITIISPMLVFSMIWTKMFAVAGARIVLGAALTIVFASGAMSLTVEVISVQGDIIKAKVDKSEKQKVSLQLKHDNMGCEVGMGSTGTVKGTQDETKAAVEKQKFCDDLRGQISSADSITVFQREYFMLVVIGFVSILLHLGSKALASQISGAQESSTGAAAVTSAMMAAGGIGWGASKYGTLMAGRGLAKAATPVLSGAAGAVGGMAAGSMAAHAQNGLAGAAGRRVPTESFGFGNEASGVGSTPGSSPDMSGRGDFHKSINELTQAIKQAIKQGGGR